MSANVKWYGDQVHAQVKSLAARRIEAAGVHLKNRLRESMSRSQPTSGAGTSKKGLSPSSPGEYPKIVTGFLRRNVQSEFDMPSLTSRVGTNVPYGRFLELGTERMARRPWLQNGLRDFSAELRAIIGGGTIGGVTTGGES